MQPEREFLILCARHSLRGEEQDGLRELVRGGLGWREIIALSGWHGIVSLVYRSLKSASPDDVPADVMARLRHLYFVNSSRALVLASELSRILTSFEKREIPVYPFKGPALSVMLYGDPMQRQSVDLDIIVPYAAVWDAMDVLATLGYVKSSRHENVKLSAFRQVDYEIPFSRNDGKLKIELQWAVVPPYFGFREEELKIWEKRRVMRRSGLSFPVLPPEETLVALCVHGAKHLWCRMGWICDVARLAAGPESLDWERLTALARRCRVLRILLLGLHLARELGGAALPEGVSAKIAADPMVGALARRVLQEVPHERIVHDDDVGRYFFHMKARERRVDQLRLAGQLMATLPLVEWNTKPLPEALYPLACLLRPLKLAMRYGAALRRDGRRCL
jgi:hypothetical protein